VSDSVYYVVENKKEIERAHKQMIEDLLIVTKGKPDVMREALENWTLSLDI